MRWCASIVLMSIVAFGVQVVPGFANPAVQRVGSQETDERDAKESGPSSAETKSHPEAAKPDVSSRRKAAPRKEFVPSEKIAPDQAVAFPVDI